MDPKPLTRQENRQNRFSIFWLTREFSLLLKQRLTLSHFGILKIVKFRNIGLQSFSECPGGQKYIFRKFRRCFKKSDIFYEKIFMPWAFSTGFYKIDGPKSAKNGLNLLQARPKNRKIFEIWVSRAFQSAQEVKNIFLESLEGVLKNLIFFMKKFSCLGLFLQDFTKLTAQNQPKMA